MSGVNALLSHIAPQRTLPYMSENTPAYRGRSAAFGAAMTRSAERRRCPKCNRKSAILKVTPWELPVSDTAYVSAYCRWDDCDYARIREVPS